MGHARLATWRRSGAAAFVFSTTLAGVLVAVGQLPAFAAVSSVTGGAFGYQTDLGLLGGPRTVKGADEPGATPSSVSYSPAVTLPRGGSATPLTASDTDGAKGQYGPAVIFGGQWPLDVASAQPSGPLSVSTQGTAAGGSVTSSAHVVLHSAPVPVKCEGDPNGTTNCTAPGGVGPGPLVADEAHSTCTATESGVSGSATFVGGILETKYDTASGLPSVTEPIPDSPPPNYTRSGTIDTVGDHYTVVFNEQVIGPDSITVNAAHMYLLGPNARGDMIVGSATCALTSTVPNGAPMAGDDTFSTDENTPLTVGAPGVLANDTDPDGNTLSGAPAQAVLSDDTDCCRMYTFPTDPPNGAVVVNPDGSFTYTPDADFHGADTFTYVAHDGRGASDTAQVTINVDSLPGDPVAGDDSYRVVEDNPLTVPAPGVLGNDVDGDGDPITAGSTTDPPHGSVTLSSNGSFTYTPDTDFVGTDSFSYVVSDSTGRTDTGFVTLTVHVDEAILLKDLAPGNASSSPSGFVQLGGSVYFLTSSNPATNGLWKTDGTAEGTVLVQSLKPFPAVPLVVMGGLMYFSASDSDGIFGTELWRSDGTTAGTAMVKDISAEFFTSSFPNSFAAIGSTLYFTADDNSGIGSELWKSDGTEAGTVMIKDIRPGPADGGGSGFTQSGGAVLFTSNDGLHDHELWRTDGTEAGTTLVKDIHPTDDSFPAGFRTVGGAVLFTAIDPVNGRELWKTDGTEAGTVIVRDINPGSASGIPTNFSALTVFGGELLFTASDGNVDPGFGFELWKSDGTEGGTELVRDINLGPAASSSPTNLTVAGDAVYFAANKGADDFEVWKTDGTDLGTLPVKNTDPGQDVFGIPKPGNFVLVNGTVYFTAAGGGRGTELWMTDGTEGGTFLAKDINPGASPSTPAELTPALGTLFFAANTSAAGKEPWRLTFTSVNDLPVATDDAYTTPAGVPLTVAAPGVLGNDADPDGGTLGAGSASDPAGGSVALNGDGSFTYTSDAGFTGTDTFTYVASDGQGTDGATVTITVTPPPGPPTLSVGDLSLNEGDGGTTTATFTVARSGNATGTSTAKAKISGTTASAGVDYTAVAQSTLSFAPGQTMRTVDVTVVGDTVPESDETLKLTLSAPSSGTVVGDNSGTATIANDDGTAYVTVSDLSVNEGSPATFTLTRSATTAGPSTLKYQTSGGTAAAGTDYTALGLASVTFDPGETTKSVTVPTTADTIDEANETLILKLSSPSAATVLSDTAATATIVDDDGPVTAGPATFLAVSDLLVPEGDAGTSPATFTVTRAGYTAGSSTVKVKIAGTTATAGVDFTAPAATTLSFALGETTKTVSVNIAGDTLAEADETFKLTLSSATGAVIADNAGIATIDNDDGTAYVVVDNTSVSEGDSGTNPATFTLTRSGNTTGPSTVTVTTKAGTATAGTDYTALALTPVSFAPGETTKTVTVNVTGDTAVEANETFTLVLSKPTDATISDTTGTATIVNDD